MRTKTSYKAWNILEIDSQNSGWYGEDFIFFSWTVADRNTEGVLNAYAYQFVLTLIKHNVLCQPSVIPQKQHRNRSIGLISAQSPIDAQLQ